MSLAQRYRRCWVRYEQDGSLTAHDPVGGASARFRALPPEAVRDGLAAVAEAQGGHVDEEDLARRAPELWFNCVGVFGSFERARHAFRMWQARASEAARASEEARAAEATRAAAAREAERARARRAAAEEVWAAAEARASDARAAAPRAPIAVRAAPREGPTTCSYCKAPFEAGETSHACACGATLHVDCRIELGRCTSFGCEAPFTAPRAAARTRAGAPVPTQVRLTRARSLAFVALALVPALVALALLVAAFALGGDLPRTALLLLAVPFALGAGLSATGCFGATVDVEDRAVRTWLGVQLPLCAPLPLLPLRRHALGAARWVELGREEWWRSNQTHRGTHVYTVSLGGRLLGAERSFLAARQLAEGLAKGLGVGVLDSVAGERCVRPPGALDVPWVEQHPPRGRPAGGRPRGVFAYRAEGDEGVFELERHVQPILTLLVVGLAIVIPIGASVPWTPALAVALPFLLAALAGDLSASARDTLRASPRGLSLTRDWVLARWTWDLPADELEELEVSAPRHVPYAKRVPEVLAAISDRVLVETGEVLEPDGRRWLRDMIAWHLHGCVEARPEQGKSLV